MAAVYKEAVRMWILWLHVDFMPFVKDPITDGTQTLKSEHETGASKAPITNILYDISSDETP